MSTQVITLTKVELIKAAEQAALVSAGIDPSTPGVSTHVRWSEELNVLVGTSFQASVSITVPDQG